MVVEEECLPTNNKSCDHVDNDSSDDNNNNDDNDDNDEIDRGSYCVFDYCDHKQSDKALEIPSYSQGTPRKCFGNLQLSFYLFKRV